MRAQCTTFWTQNECCIRAHGQLFDSAMVVAVRWFRLQRQIVQMIIPCLFGKATACGCQNTEFETIAMQFMVWPTISTEQKLSEGEERMQLWRLWLEEHIFQQCDLKKDNLKQRKTLTAAHYGKHAFSHQSQRVTVIFFLTSCWAMVSFDKAFHCFTTTVQSPSGKMTQRNTPEQTYL